MGKVIRYRCKKCGDLLHNEDIVEHHYCCFGGNMSPRDMLDDFEVVMPVFKRPNKKLAQ